MNAAVLVECGNNAGAIAPGDHVPSLQILHRKAKRVKFDRTAVIGGKTTNGTQIFDNGRGYQDIIKNEIVVRK